MGSEWSKTPLCDLTNPDTPVTYGVVKPGPKDPNGVLFIRGGDIVGGRVLVEQLRTITNEVSMQYKRTQLRGGEIVVSLVGNPGQVAIVPESLKGANIARQVGLVRLCDDVETRFVKYFLSSPDGQEALGAYCLGSVQQVINLRDLKTVEVPTPSLPEQRSIAHILGTLDEKIELNRKMNHTLEAMARAIFKSWFVDFDPVRVKAEGRQPEGMGTETGSMFPDSFEDSELGKIPWGWRVRKVADIAYVIDCLHSKKPIATDKGKHLLQVFNVGQTGRLDLSESYFISEADYTEWTKRIEVRHNDLVITKTGRVGAVARIRQGFKAAIGQILTYAAGLDAVTIVWIAERFTDEHRATIDWLNEISSEQVNFFGLEIEVWKIGDSAKAPKFNIVAKPNEWTKGGGGISRIKQAELTEKRKTQLEFWMGFREFVLDKGSIIKPTKALPQHWMNISIGRGGFKLNAIASFWDSESGSYGKHELRAEVEINDRKNAKIYYAMLESNKADIEAEVGESLIWYNPENAIACRIYLRKTTDLEDTSLREEQHDWVLKKLEALHKVFTSRIKTLDVADYRPQESNIE